MRGVLVRWGGGGGGISWADFCGGSFCFRRGRLENGLAGCFGEITNSLLAMTTTAMLEIMR